MRRKTACLSAVLFIFLPLFSSKAQEATSRLIPFSLATSLPPLTTQEVVVELWDAGSGGVLIFSEAYTGANALPVDGSGFISFRFGSLQLPPGLNPAHFPSGSARYLDVTQAGMSVLSARLPLTAVAFALSPGPEGPPGPPGPSDVPENLTMVNSTATAGNILKGGVLFLHNFGTNNTFLGSNAGNLTMTGTNNTASGNGALSSIATGCCNTASGFHALFRNTTGSSNTATGNSALFNNTTGRENTAVGDTALSLNTTGFRNTAIGVQALSGNGDFNIAVGVNALASNGTGSNNTANGTNALFSNTTGSNNTAIGVRALQNNTIGFNNTALGRDANVSAGNLTNATAIGAEAIVNDSNKVRVGNTLVTVIEGEVGFTASSDRNRKENFLPVEGEEVLAKIRRLSVTSWNFIGHDPKQFRHYGPMAQDFFAAFGHDGIGTIGTETTITSTDMDGILMVAAQALERRTSRQEKRTTEQGKRILRQSKEMNALRAENADLKARLERLERRIGSHAVAKAQ